ncbi:MAG: AI-2E family transporter [Prevotella sp.]|nr:AI-2E family transporter [Prevotella sp.]
MERQQITFDTFVRGLVAVIIVVGIVMLLSRLSGVLTPIFLAWLIAYLMFPMVRFFQYRCRMKFRILGILSAFIVVGALLTGLFLLVVPPMVEETVHVKNLLVDYLSHSSTLSNIPDAIQRYLREHFTIDDIKGIVTQQGFLEGVKATVPKLWEVLMQSISVVSGVLSTTMVVLYTLFILLDYEDICSGWPNLLPAKYRQFSVQLMGDIEDGMNKYFRGQGLVALCVGILFSIGFIIIDFPMAIGLGLFIGLLNMVPYLQLVGFIPTILLAIVKAADTGENFWVVLFMALVVFAVVQLIQDTFLTPKIMGKVTGLNSAIILLSLSIWGSLLGIMGMIIALPMTTLLITYYQRYVIRKEEEIKRQETADTP